MSNEKEFEMMNEILAYISRIQRYLPELIMQYRSLQIEKASGQMVDLAEGLLWLDHSLKSMTKGNYGYHLEKLQSLYEELVEAMGNRDYVLLADIMEYELIEEVAQIGREIENAVRGPLH